MLRRFPALEPPAWLVDASILGLVAFEVCSGLASLLVATPDAGWLFVLHGVAGVSLVVLLAWKLRRVRHRVTVRKRWDRGTPISVLLGVLAIASLSTGLAWSYLGIVRVEGFTLLVGHMVLGLVLVPILAWHLRHRFRLPGTEDVNDRRSALQFGVVLVGAAVLWRSKEVLARLAGLAGADRRFTGSKQAGGTGNTFPVTSWVADDPEPIDQSRWSLTVDGAVEQERVLTRGDLSELGGGVGPDADETAPSGGQRTATIDCTSGWYAERTWTGVSLERVLDAAVPTVDGTWVTVHSVTGYRWSFPLETARSSLLLATHVDGEALSHGHGAPFRLVAPDHRGFQWVKWVDRVEVRRSEDLSQWVAIFVSGFDG